MKTKTTTILAAITALAFGALTAPEADAQNSFQRQGSVHPVNPKTGKVYGAQKSWGQRSGYHAWNVGNLITLFNPPNGSSRGSYYTYVSLPTGQLGANTYGEYAIYGNRVWVRDTYTKSRGVWKPATFNEWKLYELR